MKSHGYVNFIKKEDLKFQGQVCINRVFCHFVNIVCIINGAVKDFADMHHGTLLFYPSGSASRRPSEAASEAQERNSASICFYYPLRAGYVSDVGVFGVSNEFISNMLIPVLNGNFLTLLQNVASYLFWNCK